MNSTFSLLDKAFLVDNGVLRNVFIATRPERAERLWQDILHRNHLISNAIRATGVAVHATPLMLIELLGISLEEIDPFSSSRDAIQYIFANTADREGDKAIDMLMDLARSKLLRQPLLDKDRLVQKFREVRSYRSELGMTFLNAMFDHSITDQKFHEYVIEVCAADRVQAINLADFSFPAKVRDTIDAAFMASFRNTLLSGRFEASYGRIVDQFYIRAVRRQQPNWMPPSSYQSMNDAVDSEIVHCAVHGVKRDGRRKSVVILSNERIRNWRPRCSRYLGAISLLNDWEVQASHPQLSLLRALYFRSKRRVKLLKNVSKLVLNSTWPHTGSLTTNSCETGIKSSRT